MKVRLIEARNHANKYNEAGSVIEMEPETFAQLKAAGALIEEVKEEVKEKKNVKDV